MTKNITVTQTISVTVDESKFTPEFMANFSHYMFDCKTIDDHIAYIAKSFATRVVICDEDFLEGYGVLRDLGISVRRESNLVEACEEVLP